jgi:hypothetical protein
MFSAETKDRAIMERQIEVAVAGGFDVSLTRQVVRFY